ncbi:HupE/UreJ family protein [Pseudooceanicola spongiae]|uniref:HupE / UreJ protein n=1 Tax=Pseudooceanicola spongiae TaxID=2613965 RepID=A0A7L9WJR5_9RHOB|nr:HupE/UreJ family protein [Pseudooceanicola spongiae]QOL80212.1 hypothetical protein F3W81_04865 [Pseudooceanicola spongiae]
MLIAAGLSLSGAVGAMADTGGSSDAVSALTTLLDFIAVGFDQILPFGGDHMLFLLALFILSPFLKPLLWQAVAFAVAQSATLALGTFGMIDLPMQILGPLLALSITLLAIETIFSASSASGVTWFRTSLVFGVGLLQGLSWARILRETGWPKGQALPELAGFSIGVGLGQIAVLLLAFVVLGVWTRNQAWYRTRVALPVAVAVASLGFYTLLERAFI